MINIIDPYWWNLGPVPVRNEGLPRIDIGGIYKLSTNAVALTESSVDYGINPCLYSKLPCESIVLLTIHADAPTGGEDLPVLVGVPSGVQNIYLEDWDWHVTVYYAVDTYYTDEILEELELIGCSWSELVKAENLLRSNQYNIGITYSNFKHKCSIVVIGLTTSAEEFQNTFDHEKGHLAMHISSALKIKPYGEEYQYLTGEIGQSMFKIAKRFLCDDCRQKLVIEIKEIDKKD